MQEETDRMQRTLVMLKPDAVQRGLMGRILARFEAKGLKIVALKMARIDRALAERHYGPHKGKDFYEPLIRFVTSGPTVFVVLEGKGAVAVVRKMMGSTFGPDADAGTIRGDFGMSKRFNLVHGSDSPEAAAHEISLFFKPEEILAWEPADWGWTYDFSTGEAV
jgi:nucleoside-diphosphate kinase